MRITDKLIDEHFEAINSILSYKYIKKYRVGFTAQPNKRAGQYKRWGFDYSVTLWSEMTQDEAWLFEEMLQTRIEEDPNSIAFKKYYRKKGKRKIHRVRSSGGSTRHRHKRVHGVYFTWWV